jgi:hypothetical protein
MNQGQIENSDKYLNEKIAYLFRLFLEMGRERVCWGKLLLEIKMML